ncbi:hypothetical protein PIB30_034199 [Stylosanthes scabra]|uniref:Uncharacterized protein n=1 Tax=Stylosanthes scabra TaxID=79078 RepID=A0ABU6RCW7_9FABA|nr:hypothetical protein [Stylosanthes scabra]
MAPKPTPRRHKQLSIISSVVSSAQAPKPTPRRHPALPGSAKPTPRHPALVPRRYLQALKPGNQHQRQAPIPVPRHCHQSSHQPSTQANAQAPKPTPRHQKSALGHKVQAPMMLMINFSRARSGRGLSFVVVRKVPYPLRAASGRFKRGVTGCNQNTE